MILGMGNDIIDMRRIEKVMKRHPERFIKRCFTQEEIDKAESRRNGNLHIATYSKRFAAKEACSKALGTGFRGGISMQDIEVKNDAIGRPTLQLKNKALDRAKDLAGGAPISIHLALTDEPPYAQASVIIETISSQ